MKHKGWKTLENLLSKQNNGRVPHTNRKQRFRRIVASGCVFCFIIVAILSTPLVVAFAEYGHYYSDEPATGCHRMRNHTCNCDDGTNSDVPVIFRNVRASIQPNQHYHHHHHHSDTEIECMACALIQKVTNPLKQFNYISNGITATDRGFHNSSLLCPELITNGAYTPVDFKTQMNN